MFVFLHDFRNASRHKSPYFLKTSSDRPLTILLYSTKFPDIKAVPVKSWNVLNSGNLLKTCIPEILYHWRLTKLLCSGTVIHWAGNWWLMWCISLCILWYTNGQFLLFNLISYIRNPTTPQSGANVLAYFI